MIVLLRAVTGAAAAGLIPLTIAYIGDTVPYDRRQATLAMLVASSGAAQAFSTSAGGVIAAVVSWRRVFPILGALAGSATFALFAFRKREIRNVVDPHAPPPTARAALRAPGMMRLLALVALEGSLFMGGFSFLSGLLDQRFRLDASSIGLILGSAGVAQLIAARILPRLLKRWSEPQLIAIGGCLMACAHVLSAVAPHWALIVLSCVLIGVGFSMCHSTLQTRATEAFARARGTALSLFAFALFSGSALGIVCVGYASEALGYGITFALLGGLMFGFTALAARKPSLTHVSVDASAP
jgi:predicted MFS family arabinose efflux permease